MSEPEELATDPPSVQEMLDSVPLHVVIADGVDLDGEKDPAATESGKRRCIAERRAGGRCTVTPLHSHVLCGGHSGLLDPAKGAQARAQSLRDQAVSAEERARMARLGARGNIADELHSDPVQLRQVVRVLRTMAAQGDKDAAKALIPYLNQGLGMPTETVRVEQPETLEDVRSMTTAELREYAASRRAAAQAELDQVT